MNRRKGRVFVLTGPTASGKTGVAHRLALRHGLPILAADSMSVYRGMDIGTAKPAPDQRREVRYYGLDLQEPDRPFSVGDYLRHVARDVPDTDMIVTGGTGLYINCLLLGLREDGGTNPRERREAEQLLASGGIAALQERLRERAPRLFEALADKRNPRRLLRALERAGQGETEPDRRWHQPVPAIAGLLHERAVLVARIGQRVRAMLDSGLAGEAARLLENPRGLSATARQAVGYAEMFDLLEGRISPAEAREAICARTRRLAKRQTAWFRHQLDVRWVACNQESTEEDIAERVWALWQELPPVHFGFDPAAFDRLTPVEES